jgi:predicted nucleotidyltransferase
MEIETLIENMLAEIKNVPGVSALVLGGSRARGTQSPNSDIDLGIYYHPDRPLDLQALNRVATHFDDAHRQDILTLPGGWGPWINGGGWLTVSGVPVDFLYRDLQKVTDVIAACHQGNIEMFYQAGHPHGFLSAMYMAEMAVCKIKWESARQEVSALKARTNPYPRALQRAIIARFAWEIDFSLANAHKSVTRGDVVYAAGCCFRAAACLLQTLFAVNQQYWLNEKGAVALLETLPLRPADFRTRIESAFTTLSTTGPAIQSAIDTLEGLSAETASLVENIAIPAR